MTPLHHRPDAIERASERRDESNSHDSCGAKTHDCQQPSVGSVTTQASRRATKPDDGQLADTIEAHDGALEPAALQPHDDDAGPRAPANALHHRPH